MRKTTLFWPKAPLPVQDKLGPGKLGPQRFSPTNWAHSTFRRQIGPLQIGPYISLSSIQEQNQGIRNALYHARYTTASLLLKNGFQWTNIIGWSIGIDPKNTSRKAINLAEPSLGFPRNYLLMVRKSV